MTETPRQRAEAIRMQGGTDDQIGAAAVPHQPVSSACLICVEATNLAVANVAFISLCGFVFYGSGGALIFAIGAAGLLRLVVAASIAMIEEGESSNG